MLHFSLTILCIASSLVSPTNMNFLDDFALKETYKRLTVVCHRGPMQIGWLGDCAEVPTKRKLLCFLGLSGS